MTDVDKINDIVNIIVNGRMDPSEFKTNIEMINYTSFKKLRSLGNIAKLISSYARSFNCFGISLYEESTSYGITYLGKVLYRHPAAPVKFSKEA